MPEPPEGPVLPSRRCRACGPGEARRPGATLGAAPGLR